MVRRRLCVSCRWSLLLHLVHDSLEGLGIVQGEVSEDLTVDFDTGFVEQTHELRVAQIVLTGSGVDALNPQCAEVALLVFAVAVSIGKTLFPSILGYGPYVTAASEVAAGKFQNFFTACA